MKAIVMSEYGSADILTLKEVDKPAIKENEVLVVVQAAALNAGDSFSMRGDPWLARFSVGFPKHTSLQPGIICCSLHLDHRAYDSRGSRWKSCFGTEVESIADLASWD